MRVVLEIIVSSVEDALEAARGGADRLEVVKDLHKAGLTPPIELVRDIARVVSLPLRVMVRERDSFECSGEQELHALCDAAQALDDLRVEGMILGWVRDGDVDHETLSTVLAAAPHLRATFHRAFDALPDPRTALAALRRHPQIDRVLSGGGEGSWAERCARLSELARAAEPRIRVLPGGSVDRAAVQEIARTPGLFEAHVGRAVRIPPTTEGRVSADLVRALRADLAR